MCISLSKMISTCIAIVVACLLAGNTALAPDHQEALAAKGFPSPIPLTSPEAPPPAPESNLEETPVVSLLPITSMEILPIILDVVTPTEIVPEVEDSNLCQRCPIENNCQNLCHCETGECIDIVTVATGSRAVSSNYCSICRPTNRCRRFHWCRNRG